MTSIPQLRRDINDLRAKLREVETERDAALARPVKEVPGPERKVPTRCPKQAREIEALKDEVARLKARPPKRVEVPGPERVVVREVVKEVPCPEQKAQIKALQSKLDRFAKYDMKEFERWCKMRAIAEGK